VFAGSKWLKDFSFSMNLSELWSFFLNDIGTPSKIFFGSGQ